MRIFINFFLENGADIETPSGECGNALHTAACHSNENILNKVLQKGVNVNLQGYGSALQAAAFWQSCCINIQGSRFGTALQTAAFWGCEDMVIYLLDCGAYINAQGGEYTSALQAAAFHGYIDIDACYVLNGHRVDDDLLNGALC
ncbi:ankyrin repeat-containing domain protein [Lentinula edodes]|nr:ankyrin repeat-containing domain protein [Lentinula edodes]